MAYPNNLNRRKAARPDGTQNKVLQHLPQIDFKFIAKIYSVIKKD